MFSPRGGVDESVLQTPRRLASVSPQTTPRSGAPMNLGMYQKKRFEFLAETGGKLTQDAIGMLHSIIKNAMLSGRTHARIQTIRISRQFSYILRDLKETLPLYDAHTLQPFPPDARRIQLHRVMDPLVAWLKEQGVHFICTTKTMNRFLTFGTTPFADFVHIEAIFIPEDTDLREQTGRVLALWNSVYMLKCLDASMVSQWNQRALAALRTGATHFAVCTLYLEYDYTERGNTTEDEFSCDVPREHLTMMPIEPNPNWKLDQKFSYLIMWAKQLGYAWTLCTGYSREECRPSNWAYFTVMLDPLEEYY